MDTYTFVWRNGDVATGTPAQLEKLTHLAERFALPAGVVQVDPAFGYGNDIMLNVGTMWICVLPDGSSHS